LTTSQFYGIIYYVYAHNRISGYIRIKEEDQMAKPLQEELAQFHAGICQALADTTRIAILYELAEGRKNVSQLVEALGSPQATVSRHLKVLRERGVVNNERDGVHIYYSLADQRIIEALDLLRGVMADILAQRRRLAEALGES
jgi:DNA-binding transcriptional ArsR family regulator